MPPAPIQDACGISVVFGRKSIPESLLSNGDIVFSTTRDVTISPSMHIIEDIGLRDFRPSGDKSIPAGWTSCYTIME
jgi:hypothetical protein